MEKEWFILINGQKEGPYSYLDLKRDARLTPDTLVWKSGFENWTAIRLVPELEDLFKEDSDVEPIKERFKPKPLPSDAGQEEATLTMQRDPFQFFLWLLLILAVFLYLVYSLYDS